MVDLSRILQDVDRLVAQLKLAVQDVRLASNIHEQKARLQSAQDAASAVDCRIEDMVSEVENHNA